MLVVHAGQDDSGELHAFGPVHGEYLRVSGGGRFVQDSGLDAAFAEAAYESVTVVLAACQNRDGGRFDVIGEPAFDSFGG